MVYDKLSASTTTGYVLFNPITILLLCLGRAHTLQVSLVNQQPPATVSCQRSQDFQEWSLIIPTGNL